MVAKTKPIITREEEIQAALKEVQEKFKDVKKKKRMGWSGGVVDLLQQGEERTYKITLIEPMLGTIPRDKELYVRYVAARALEFGEPVDVAEELKFVPEPENEEERKSSPLQFYADPETGAPVLLEYQFRGFLKEVGDAFSDFFDITALKNRITSYVFVSPKVIELFRDVDGKQTRLMEHDSVFARPMRTLTQQGPRVTIVQSDLIEAGTYFYVSIRTLPNKHTVSSDVVESILSYGKRQGLLQWRTAGYGSFVAESVS